MLLNNIPDTLIAKIAMLNGLSAEDIKILNCYGAVAIAPEYWQESIDHICVERDVLIRTKKEDDPLRVTKAIMMWGPQPGYSSGMNAGMWGFFDQDPQRRVRFGLISDGWRNAATVAEIQMMQVIRSEAHGGYADYHFFGTHHAGDSGVWFHKCGSQNAEIVFNYDHKPASIGETITLFGLSHPRQRPSFEGFWYRPQKTPLRPAARPMIGEIEYTTDDRKFLEDTLMDIMKSNPDKDMQPIRDFAALRGLTLTDQLTRIAP